MRIVGRLNFVVTVWKRELGRGQGNCVVELLRRHAICFDCKGNWNGGALQGCFWVLLLFHGKHLGGGLEIPLVFDLELVFRTVPNLATANRAVHGSAGIAIS